MPLPCWALTGMGAPRPSVHNWSSSSSWLGPSTLLATKMKGTPLRNKRRATPWSSSTSSEVASATNTTTSAPPTAISACSRMFMVSSSSGFDSQPPVSISMNRLPSHSAVNSRRSLVTPGCSSTTAALRCRIRLTSVDLPTLGRPRTVTTGSRLIHDAPSTKPATVGATTSIGAR